LNEAESNQKRIIEGGIYRAEKKKGDQSGNAFGLAFGTEKTTTEQKAKVCRLAKGNSILEEGASLSEETGGPYSKDDER